MVSKKFLWNAKYEAVYRWLASFIVIYTIMNLKRCLLGKSWLVN
jgi:hypothetical protein